MIANSRDPIDFQDKRWKAVRFGLRLANSYLGPGLMVLFYGLWALIGLLLCFVLIPFAVMGKVDAFKNALDPVALYGLVVPMALMAAATWAVKYFSRLLWCAIPEPLMAMFLALASVAGRLSVLIGIVYIWLRSGPWGKGLLLPEVVACAGIAWLGLVADWGFIRALQHEFIPATYPAQSSGEMDAARENAPEAERVMEQPKESMLKRDVGEWFKRRFPKSYKLVVWILLPVGYVAISSLANNADPKAVPEAILRLAVIAPAILQIFWIPGGKMGGLIDSLTPKTVQESVNST